MNRPMQLALVAAVAAAGLAAGYLVGRPSAVPPLALERATLFSAPRAVPDLVLVDQDGAPFGTAALAGRWNLLFFGFTHCPDVCPATLATLAAARRELADLPEDRQPRIIMITVDPERDTADKLKQYVGFFDPSLRGLTGDPDTIATLTSALGVAVRRGPADEHGYYTVDHTAALFLVDPQGDLAGILGTPHTPDGIAHDYRLIVEARGRRG